MKLLSMLALAGCSVLTLSCATRQNPNQLTVRPIQSDSSRGELEWEIALQNVELRIQTSEENGRMAARVVGANLQPIAEPGEPDVPAASTLFSLPRGWQWQVMELTDGQPSLVQDNVEVTPYRVCYRCENPEANNNQESEAQRQAYFQQPAFPLSRVQAETISHTPEHELVRVSLRPARYSPQQRKLVWFASTRVRLRAFAGNEATVKPATPFLASVSHAAGLEVPHAPAAARPPKLIVLVADKFKSEPELENWITWKNEAGFQTQLVTVSEVGKSASLIQSYLQRNSVPGDFVLLVGDHSELPTFHETVGWQVAASDYPYVRYSSTNHFPARFVGRVTASTAAQLRTQFARFLQVDRASRETLWHERATTIASSEGFSPSDVQYAQSIERLLLGEGLNEVDRFYEQSRTARAESIRSALAEGRTWLSYFGHGNGSAWTSTNGPFSIEDVVKVDNRGKLPMIVDVACDNGAWTRLEPSFSESWMNHEVEGEPAGSVGYFGGSVKVSWHEPAVMAVGVADYRFRRKAALMGQAVFAGQIYMLEKMGLTRQTLNNLIAYNLFGDPTLVVRTQAAQDWTLNVNLTNNELVFSATTADGKPVTGLFVGVSSQGKALGRWELNTTSEQRWVVPPGVSRLRLTGYGNGWSTRQVDL